MRLDEEVEVVPWERELVAGQKIVDHLFVIDPKTAGARIEHVESLARWSSRETNNIVERAMTISVSPELSELPLRTTVLLMLARDVPRVLLEVFPRVRGDLTVNLTVRFRKVWEENGRAVLALNREAALPLVPLTRHTWEDMDAAASWIERIRDEDLASQFLANASYVYNRDVLTRRYEMLLAKESLEIAKETWFGKVLSDDARDEGREEGRIEATRELLRKTLAMRFPVLESHPAVDRPRSAGEASRVFSEVMAARDESEARAALESSAG